RTRACISLLLHLRLTSPPLAITTTPAIRMPSTISSRNGSSSPRRSIAHPYAPGSVRGLQQAAGDDIGLNFGRAFEDIENAGIAQDAADRIFQRIAVAAMNLERI